MIGREPVFQRQPSRSHITVNYNTLMVRREQDRKWSISDCYVNIDRGHNTSIDKQNLCRLLIYSLGYGMQAVKKLDRGCRTDMGYILPEQTLQES